MSELQRASVMAVVEEVTLGTLKAPSASTEFIPMRAGGDELAPELEILENDELKNSIGATKSATGKENPTGSHSAFLKHSGTAGTAPNWSIILRSCLGSGLARNALDAVLAGTTTLKAVVAAGAAYKVGEAILVQATNGTHFIRNVASISNNDLTYNFAAIDAADGSVIGKNYAIKPASSGHPSFSTWVYRGNGGAIEAAAGCRTNSAAIEITAGQFAEINFDYQATAYYFNPIEITAATKYIDFTDDTGTFAAVVATGFYKTPIALAEAIQEAMNGVAGDEITVSYSNTTGKFTIASDGAVTFSLLWNTGANTANTIGTKIGFAVAADDTAAFTYASDNAQVYTAAFVPDYDNIDNIVVKDNELFIGGVNDSVCVKMSSGSINIDNETVDIDSICAESGLLERLINARSVTMSAEIVYGKYDVKFIDALLQNKSLTVMLNVGPKVGGNWVPGKCVNIYLPNVTITSHALGGDDAIVGSIEMAAFVTDTQEDAYINFV